jgi:hypothetical protein
MVLLASIFLGLSEVLYVTTMGVRDRFLYRTCCGSCASNIDGEATFDPFAAMKAKSLLRARNAHLETVSRDEAADATTERHQSIALVLIFAAPVRAQALEFCFTIVSAVALIVFDISPPGDGKGSPNVGSLAVNIVIQVLTEVLVDYCSCAWLVVKAKQPILAVAHLNFEGWTIFICGVMFAASALRTDTNRHASTRTHSRSHT